MGCKAGALPVSSTLPVQCITRPVIGFPWYKERVEVSSVIKEQYRCTRYPEVPCWFCAGLGLEFVRQLLERPGYVIATCRQPEFAVGLQELQSFHNDRLLVVQLDTTDERSIERAVHQVSARHSRLDTLINVSGVLHVPNILSPETSIARLTLESLELSFRTNTFGPILVCKAFLPLLITAGDARGGLKYV